MGRPRRLCGAGRRGHGVQQVSTPTARPKRIKFITRDDHKLYIHPETGEFIPGVTSTIGNIPKPYLKLWGQKVVAQAAVAKIGSLNKLAEHDPEGAVDWLKRAPDRDTSRAAKVGHEAHELFAELSVGNTIGNVPDYLQPFEYHFKDYLDTIQPEHILVEEGVWDEAHNYAGTFDAIVRYNRPDLFLDYEQTQPLVGVAWEDRKTTRSGVHAEVGLQLAAYRHAQYLLRPDGSTMNNKPGDMAIVLHVRPEGWALVPIRAGREELEFFYTLQAVNGWRALEKGIIGPTIIGNREVKARRRNSKETTA